MGFFDRFFGPPSEDQFAKIMIDTLRRVGDVRTPVYDKAEFRLTFTKDGKQEGVINLRNLFTEYCKTARKERQALLARTCKGLAFPMTMPEEFEDARPDLMPTLRTRSMPAVMQLDSEIAGNSPVEFPWVDVSEELIACLVYDLPNSMQFVTGEMLSTWGITIYEALECARQNLAEREVPLLSIGDKLFIVETGDAYDATRLLLTDRVARLPVDGQPVAMPITRDCLMITGSDDEVGLGMMAAVAEKKKGEARPLCPIPVRLVDDDWETWMPADSSPHFEKFRLLALQYYADEYATQKQQLEARNEQLGRDVFVATFSAVERNEKLLSYSVWSKGVPTWLPKTDFVSLLDPDRERIWAVPWHRLEESAGHLLEAIDCHPPRWSAEEFPTDDQIQRMRPED